MDEFKELTLETIANGAANELFSRELDKVLENIDDPNIKADSTRSITLKFSFTPDAKKQSCDVSVESKATLTPVLKAKGAAYFGRRNGKLRSFTHNVNQMDLDFQTQPTLVTQEAKENA